MIAAERDEAARAAGRDEVATLNPADLVFIDETRTPTALTPTYARAPRGVRAIGRVPHRRGHNVTLLAAPTPDGIATSVMIAGATDRAVSEAFVTQQLVPNLRPGQTVILANLSVPKSAAARDTIAAAGCHLRFLPTYSPDFNPIEQAFAKVKQHLRRAASRTYDTLCAAAGPALDAITAADAAAFSDSAGYPLDPGQPL